MFQISGFFFVPGNVIEKPDHYPEIDHDLWEKEAVDEVTVDK